MRPVEYDAVRLPRGRRSRRAGWLAAMLAVCMIPLAAAPLAAQEGSVGGAVVAEQSLRPLQGAQIVVVGTPRGTITDASGRFLITGVTGPEVQLQVRMIGYRTVTLPVRLGDTSVRIALAEAAVELDAVVVTGTPGGTQRRALGNVVSQINAAEVVETAPVRDLQQLINGRAPGVVVIPGSGMVGTGSRIRVRGVSSLSLAQEPLIYVDGVRVNNAQATGPINQGFGSSPISRFNDFNPEDIESIEIIKGPAAATLYGTEAANGVVQIITKKGTAGAPRFSFTMKQGANWFANAESRVYTNYGVHAATNDTIAINMVALERERGNDIFRTGHLQEYDLNASGGSQGVRYYVGGSVLRNGGIEPNNSIRRFSGRANVSIVPSENLDITASTGYVTGRTNLSLEAGGGGLFWTTLFSNPANLTFANGDPHPRRGFHSATPEAYYHAYQDWQDLNRFTGSVQLNHRPSGWLTHRLTVGTDLTLEDNVELVERIEDPAMQFFFTPGEIRGYKDIRSHRTTYSTGDYSATAKATPIAGWSSSTSAGLQFYHTRVDTLRSYGEDFPARGLRSVRAAARNESAENYVETTTVGVFLQQQFGWRERLFVTGAIRADDNSAFGENFDLVYYPKLSATWVLSEEPFWRLPFVDQFRVRAAYGESGQQPQSFAALRYFLGIPGPGGGSAVTPGGVGNPDLGPERGRELELGFDAGFLDQRLGLEFTYYNSRTRDAILERDIAPSTGFSGRQFINAGEIANRGFEVLARAQPVRARNIGWDVSLSVATNENEIIDLGIPGLDFVSAGTFVQHREGYPVGSWFERRLVGAQFNANGILVAGSEMCDDGRGGAVPCGQAPLVFLGRPTPKTEGALTSTVTLFERLRLYALLDFKSGYSKLDGNLRVRCVLFRRCHENFYPQDYLDDPAWLAQTQRGGAFVNDLIRDSGFSRLREVSASYTVPNEWLGPFNASRATISVAGRNLYTWTDYSGLEPEASFLGGTRGGGSAQWEQNVVPALQQFVATISFSF